MVNAQEYLDENYPKENRNQINEINISWKNSEGSLSLEGFINLKKIECFNNQLTSLDLSDCRKITEFHCANNKLSSININSEQELTYFNCKNNQLTTLDLEKRNNLEFLNCSDNFLVSIQLPNENEKLKKVFGENNNFEQDLSIFQNFVNLEILTINNNLFSGSLKWLKRLEKTKIFKYF